MMDESADLDRYLPQMRYVRTMRQRSHHRTVPWFLAHVARVQSSATTETAAVTLPASAVRLGKRSTERDPHKEPVNVLSSTLLRLLAQLGVAVQAGVRFVPPDCAEAMVDHQGNLGGVCAAAMGTTADPAPLSDTWRCFLDTAALLKNAAADNDDSIPAAPQWLGRNTAWHEFTTRYLSRPAVRPCTPFYQARSTKGSVAEGGGGGLRAEG
jgi:hypothetical protein